MPTRRPARLTLAALALLAAAGCSTKPPTAATATAASRNENPWPRAAAELRRGNDLTAVRRALDQLRTDLVNTTDASFQPTGLDPAREKAVRELLNLNDRDLAEIRPAAYTPLDGHHIAQCYYLRDVVRSLGFGATPPELQARAVFDWVTRQVALTHWLTSTGSGPQFMPPAPPSMVMSRGAGSGLERAYVFLALVNQLGLDGCLVGPPDAAQRPWSYDAAPLPNVPPKGPFWAVGVRVNEHIYLFDPWRGEAVPGPPANTGGVATLAQVQADPALLAKWRADATQPWTVPQETVAASVPFLIAPLSALAPRFQRLESELRNESPAVRLYTDAPETRSRFAAATPSKSVGFWNPPTEAFGTTRTMAAFVPPKDGGLGVVPDIGTKYLADQIPFELFAMPDALLPRPAAGPSDPGDPGIPEAVERLRVLCVSSYAETFLTAPSPRERLQRGQFAEVAPLLVQRRAGYAAGLERLRTDQGREDAVRKWASKARDVYINLLRARDRSRAEPGAAAAAAADVEAFWKSDLLTVTAIADAAVSEAGVAEAAYLLALCLHEQAVRAETAARQAAAAKSGGADRARSAASAEWAEAAAAWGRYLPLAAVQAVHFPARPAHAERLAAEARAAR